MLEPRDAVTPSRPGALPHFYPVRFPRPHSPPSVSDRAIGEAAAWLLDNSAVFRRKAPWPRRAGRPLRVAVTAGSRGLARAAILYRALTGTLAQRGVEAFLVPAMGSHGGGHPEGRREILATLGLTGETVRAPVLPAREMAYLGRTPAGRPVYCHPGALWADAVLVVNRVGSHPSFEGRVQSGLLKMLAVGLGGPPGAVEVHRRGAAGLEEAIVDTAHSLAGRLAEGRRLGGGLAVVEDSLGRIISVTPAPGTWPALVEADRVALALARALAPSLPVQVLDLLLVDRMGKDISGPGMDPRITGRRGVWDYPDPPWPKVRRLVVFRLSRGPRLWPTPGPAPSPVGPPCRPSCRMTERR